MIHVGELLLRVLYRYAIWRDQEQAAEKIAERARSDRGDTAELVKKINNTRAIERKERGVVIQYILVNYAKPPRIGHRSGAWKKDQRCDTPRKYSEYSIKTPVASVIA